MEGEGGGVKIHMRVTIGMYMREQREQTQMRMRSWQVKMTKI